MTDEMTPYDRTYRRMAGEPVDRLPNQNILMAFAARYIGSTYDRLVQDYRVLVEGNLRAIEAFHIDWASAISDPMREASAFGATVEFPYDRVPYSPTPLLASYADWNKLALWDPWEHERPRDRLQAIALYRQKVGGYYPIVGWVEGAAAEAADLRGVAALMEDMLTEPGAVHDLLEICTQAAIRFAVAQVEAGADMIGDRRRRGLADEPTPLSRVRPALRAAHHRGHPRGGGQGQAAHLRQHQQAPARHGQNGRRHHRRGLDGGHGRGGAHLCRVAAPTATMTRWPCSTRARPRMWPRRCAIAWPSPTSRSMISAGCEVPADTPHENLLAHYEALRSACGITGQIASQGTRSPPPRWSGGILRTATVEAEASRGTPGVGAGHRPLQSALPPSRLSAPPAHSRAHHR